MKPTPEDLAILRALVVSGAVTKTELRKPFPDLLVDRIDVLYTHGLVHQDRIPNKPSIWEISYKGKRELERAKDPYVGIVAGSRTYTPTGTYAPEKWEPPRPESNQCNELGSMVNGKWQPRTAPVINGGSKERG